MSRECLFSDTLEDGLLMVWIICIFFNKAPNLPVREDSGKYEIQRTAVSLPFSV